MNKWNNRFMELAKHISTWSKDKSRGVGAVIVSDEKRILSIGFNGFPSGINDDIEERHQRPVKYKWTEHAERNAIYNAGKHGISLQGATMYVTLFPCTDCARAIIQSGIKMLITKAPNFNDSKFGEDFKVSQEMLNEANVGILLIEKI